MLYLSHVLDDLMKKRELTATRAWKLSGIHPSIWSRWLSGEQPAMSDEHFEIIATTIFKDELDQAEILRARMMNICRGPGSGLIEIKIKGKSSDEALREKSVSYRLPRRIRKDVDSLIERIPQDRNLRELIHSIDSYTQGKTP